MMKHPCPPFELMRYPPIGAASKSILRDHSVHLVFPRWIFRDLDVDATCSQRLNSFGIHSSLKHFREYELVMETEGLRKGGANTTRTYVAVSDGAHGRSQVNRRLRRRKLLSGSH